MSVIIDGYLSVRAASGITGIGVRGELAYGGNNWTADIQDVGTSNEALTIGDCSGACIVLLVNTDATNFVTIYADNGDAKFITKLLPGQFAFWWTAVTPVLYAKADTLGIKLRKVIIEGVTIVSLEQYQPSVPAIGYLTERLSLHAELGGVTISEDITVSVTGASKFTNTAVVVTSTATDPLYNEVWPALTGTMQTAMLVNTDVSATSTVRADGSVTYPSAYLLPNNGFAIIPLNITTASSPKHVGSTTFSEQLLVIL